LIRAIVSSRLSASLICFMQILKRIGIILVWLAGAVFIFAAANKNDPYLIALRGPGNIVLAAAGIMVVVVLIRRGYWRRGIAGRLLILLWCLPSLSMRGAHASLNGASGTSCKPMLRRREVLAGTSSSGTCHSRRRLSPRRA
jgi:cell division protein FtsW (lipid II flippase)